ncbi:MAG: iron ABC transporter ATP-binding protein [Robiginitomaculum sp.]|nr:MAG: iron ABC transporter ATP-binding protein [Robiginitomaculum sp.]
MTELKVENITLHAEDTPLVQNASFSLCSGELIALLGPNGAGKTSLLRAALGLVKTTSGKSTLGGTDVTTLSPITRARRISYLPQSRPLAWPNTIRDVVALGRFSHGATLGKLKGIDAEAVEEAMAACDILHMQMRKTDTLSGGELARVHCARAFAAQAPLLIADEPVAALDPRHQFRVMDLIRRYVDNGGGALVVLHDIALAARYADQLIWMKDSKIHAQGTPAQTLTESRLRDIYRIKAKIDGLNIQIEGAL